MAKLIKISATKAIRISVIQMGKKVKGQPAPPKLLSIRQMYATTKDPVFKPAYQGITLNIESDEAKRVIKAMIAVFKDPDQKVEIIEPKSKGKK